MGRRKKTGNGEKKRGGHGHGYRRPGRHYNGEPLWKLLYELPDHGVGRLIVRGSFKQNEEEPSYMRILEVDYSGRVPHKKKEGKFNLPVKVERVFRGVVIPNRGNIFSTSYLPDFNLVPLEEEEKLIKNTKTAREKGYVFWTAAQKRNIRNLVNQGIPIQQAKQMEKQRIFREEAQAATADGNTPNQEPQAMEFGPDSSGEILYDNFDDADDDEKGNETDESDNGPEKKLLKISEANPVPESKA